MHKHGNDYSVRVWFPMKLIRVIYDSANGFQKETKRYMIMIKMVFNQLFIKQCTGYSFILGIITGVLAYFLNIPYLYPLAFVLITNTFDLIGYGQIMEVVSNSTYYLSAVSGLYSVIIPYYRIIQKLFNWLLVVTIWSITGNWIIAIACLCANFGGFQDVLYYLFGRYNFNQNYTWLRWTPLGMLIGDLNKWEFVIQGIVSFLLVSIILLIL